MDTKHIFFASVGQSFYNYSVPFIFKKLFPQTVYPVKLGFEEAIKRIQELSKNGHHAESLVTSTFTAEKTIRRTLRQLVVSAGFKSSIADKILNNIRALEALKKNWEFYEPNHKRLTDIISPEDWKIIKNNSERRNDLVHGTRVFSLSLCETETTNNITALTNIKRTFDSIYGYSGWEKTAIRKQSKLHVDPKVKKVVG